MTAASVKYELLMQVVLLYKSIFSLNFKNSQKVSIPVGNLLSSGIHTTVVTSHPSAGFTELPRETRKRARQTAL